MSYNFEVHKYIPCKIWFNRNSKPFAMSHKDIDIDYEFVNGKLRSIFNSDRFFFSFTILTKF